MRRDHESLRLAVLGRRVRARGAPAGARAAGTAAPASRRHRHGVGVTVTSSRRRRHGDIVTAPVSWRRRHGADVTAVITAPSPPLSPPSSRRRHHHRHRRRHLCHHRHRHGVGTAIGTAIVPAVVTAMGAGGRAQRRTRGPDTPLSGSAPSSSFHLLSISIHRRKPRTICLLPRLSRSFPNCSCTRPLAPQKLLTTRQPQ